MLAVHTFPLVTALRKKGSSFPANLASSSYFSRPEKTKLQTIEQTFKKKTLGAFSTSLSSFKESDLTNPFIRLSTKSQPKVLPVACSTGSGITWSALRAAVTARPLLETCQRLFIMFRGIHKHSEVCSNLATTRKLFSFKTSGKVTHLIG